MFSVKNPFLFKKTSPTRQKASKKKIAIVLTLSLLLLAAIPLSFAVANPNSLLNNAIAGVASLLDLPNSSAHFAVDNASEPMTLEQGIEALTVDDRHVVDVAAGDAMTRGSVSSGHTGFSLAILNDGTLWAWGANRQGALGLGSNSEFTLNVPTQVGTANTWTNVFAGRSQSMAIRSDGTLWIWGDNTNGQAGQGFISDSISVPTQVGTGTNWIYVAAINNTGGLSSAHDTTLAIQSDGTLWTWGSNNGGRTGLGITTGHTLTPTQVGSSSNWTSVSGGINHSLAVQSDGTLWAWGSNSSGRTGLGITSGTTLVPTQVGAGANWVSASVGVHYSLAVQSDGTLWAWGSNASGQTGLDTTVGNASVPTQVGSSANWVDAAAGTGHSLGIQSDGTLWAWGSNNNGQTGLNTGTGNTLVPTQVGSSSNWASISAGQQHSLAVQSDGTLWASGGNNGGATGQGSNAGNTLIPLPVMPVAVTAMAPTGIDLAPASVTTLTINFDFPVRSGIGDRVITLTNTATNSTVALGQWVLAADGLSMAVPVTGTLDFETTYRINISGWHSIFGAPLTAANQTFTTGEAPEPMDGAELPLTKIIDTPLGTTTPDARFEFSVRQVTESGANFVLASPATVASASPDIDFASGETTGTIGNIFAGMTFPHAGDFAFVVTEVSGTNASTLTPEETMLYSEDAFIVRVRVINDPTGGVVPDQFVIHAAVPTTLPADSATAWTWDSAETAKLDEIVFTNTFIRDIGDPNNPALTISKTVTGDIANLTLAFDFTAILGLPTQIPAGDLPATITATVVDSTTGNPVTPPQTIAFTQGSGENIRNYTANFALTHNQTLVFATLPAGTAHLVVETQESGYDGRLIITSGGNEVFNEGFAVGINVSGGTQIVADTGANTVSFTNNHNEPPFTGLVVGSAPIAVIAVLVAVLLAMMAASRARRRLEEAVFYV